MTQSGKLVLLFAKIDGACTGHASVRPHYDYGEIAEQVCEEWLFMGTLYLGDGGYSRLIIDTTDTQEVKVLRPSWNSSERCLKAWEEHGDLYIKEFEKIRSEDLQAWLDGWGIHTKKGD